MMRSAPSQYPGLSRSEAGLQLGLTAQTRSGTGGGEHDSGKRGTRCSIEAEYRFKRMWNRLWSWLGG